MKCGNHHCMNGLEPVWILDSTPQEMYVLAQHLPNSKPHMHKEMWPCRYCNPRWRAKFEANRKDAAERSAVSEKSNDATV